MVEIGCTNIQTSKDRIEMPYGDLTLSKITKFLTTLSGYPISLQWIVQLATNGISIIQRLTKTKNWMFHHLKNLGLRPTGTDGKTYRAQKIHFLYKITLLTIKSFEFKRRVFNFSLFKS